MRQKTIWTQLSSKRCRSQPIARAIGFSDHPLVITSRGSSSEWCRSHTPTHRGVRSRIVQILSDHLQCGPDHSEPSPGDQFPQAIPKVERINQTIPRASMSSDHPLVITSLRQPQCGSNPSDHHQNDADPSDSSPMWIISFRPIARAVSVVVRFSTAEPSLLSHAHTTAL